MMDSEVESVMGLIVAWSAAAAYIVKVAIDAVRQAKEFRDAPTYVWPFVALTLGPVVVTLLMVASGKALTVQLVALCILAGLLAGGAAIGATSLHDRRLPSGDTYPQTGGPEVKGGKKH